MQCFFAATSQGTQLTSRKIALRCEEKAIILRSITHDSANNRESDLECLRNSHHFDEIVRLTTLYGSQVSLDCGAIEFAAVLEDAALDAGKDDKKIAFAIAQRCRELLAEFQ